MLEAPWGQTVFTEEVAQKLISDVPFAVVTVVASETSTGTVPPL